MSDEELDPIMVASQQRVGTMLSGKWRLDALIGVGGMAAVYASTHRNGAGAAIKVLHAEYAGNQEIRARFLREAYIANKVTHSGTVRVLDDDISEAGDPYLVMELLTGESVEARARRNGGWLRYQEVLTIVEQTLAVLENAHAAGVVHRDLKPDNLFMTTKGEVKLLDFGIARLHEAASSKRTQTGLMMGTPAFMAPEQALGKWPQIDGRTDLWSVGAIFFNLLSGRIVHEGQTDNEIMIRAATRPAPSLGRAVPKAPVEVVRVVDRALQFEQAARFPDAASMRVAVRALMAAAGVQPWGGAATAPVPGTAAAVPVGASAAPVVPASRSTSASPAMAVAPAARSTGASQAMAVAPATRTAAGVAPPVAAAQNAGARAHPTTAPVASVAMGATSARQFGGAPTMPLGPGGAAPAAAVESLGGGQASQVRATRQQPDDQSYQADYATEEDLGAMKELFVEVEKALIAKNQYGEAHPEARRRADRAFRAAASGLMHSEYGLVWNVTPYAFVSNEQSLWEPQAPLDRVPYQLFADGVRTLGFLNGLEEREFQEFLGLLTLDRATEVAPEDDFATLLWDANFEHVVHQVVDTFADGDQDKRLQFEQQREQIVQSVVADTSEELAASWQDRAPVRSQAQVGTTQRKILAHLSSGPVDAEAVARAANLHLAARDDSALDMSVLRVDESLRTMLAARLTMEAGGLSERFAKAVARAFEDAYPRDGGAVVTVPIRGAIDALAKGSPALAIDMVGAFCREVGQALPPAEAESMRASVAGAIVSPKMMQSVLEGARAAGDRAEVYARGLGMILGYCDATYFSVVLQELGQIPDSDVRDVLVEYLARHGLGHEAEIGTLFAEADLELGLSLVRLLARVKSSAAREAISQAAHSPHPVVRIEALGHVEGVSSERLRLELRALLEDREPGVRLAALKAMEQYSIRAAGPALVLRVRSEGFDALPADERRQALQTLAALAPNRAESVALEIVKARNLVASGEHEVSRELAVELLGRVGATKETREVLVDVATARFRNSELVRASAAKALEAFLTRAEAPVRPPEPAAKPRGKVPQT